MFPPSHGLALFEVPPSTTMEDIADIFQRFGTVVGLKVSPFLNQQPAEFLFQNLSPRRMVFVYLSRAREARKARVAVEAWGREGRVRFTARRALQSYTPAGRWAVTWDQHLAKETEDRRKARQSLKQSLKRSRCSKGENGIKRMKEGKSEVKKGRGEVKKLRGEVK